MKVSGKSCLSAILAALVGIAGNAFAMDRDLVDTAIADDRFETLVSLVKEAGLVETLKGDGPFTLFAPTDAAFEQVGERALRELRSDKEKLAAVLTYHVVPGSVPAAKVTTLSSARTVQGESLVISTADGVKVDEASVIETDIKTSNGIIHVVDQVLMP